MTRHSIDDLEPEQEPATEQPRAAGQDSDEARRLAELILDARAGNLDAQLGLERYSTAQSQLDAISSAITRRMRRHHR